MARHFPDSSESPVMHVVGYTPIAPKLNINLIAEWKANNNNSNLYVVDALSVILKVTRRTLQKIYILNN